MRLFYVAFQNTTAPSNAAYTWNSISTIATTLSAALKDSGGTASSYGLTMNTVTGVTKNSFGLNAAGSGNASWVNQAAIVNETFTFANNNSLTFTGLNNSRTYNIKIFGSQNGTGTNNINFTIGGVNQVLNISNNATQILTFSGVSPSSSNIPMTITKDTGSFRVSAILLEELNASISSLQNPVYPNGSFNYSASGFGTLSTIATDKTGVTVSSVGASSAVLSDFVVGGLYPVLPTSIAFTFGDGTNSASASSTLQVPLGFTKIPVVDAIHTENTYFAGIVYQTDGRILQTADTIYCQNVSGMTMSADTAIKITTAALAAKGGVVIFDVWVNIGTGTDAGKMYLYTVTLTEALQIPKKMFSLGFGLALGFN